MNRLSYRFMTEFTADDKAVKRLWFMKVS